MKDLPDVHLQRDTRGLALDRVGVKNLSLPITVQRMDGRALATVGRFDLEVSVEAKLRGAHLSRLAAAVQDRSGPWTLDALEALCDELRTRLQARTAAVELTFPFFLEKAAPVSGARGLVEIEAALRVRTAGKTQVRELVTRVPVTTLCPCSQAISAQGAHNQRTLVELHVEARRSGPARHRGRAVFPVFLEELVRISEDAASCEVFAVLKRPDEKWVTERAYARPRFVEDLVREAALSLRAHSGVARFTASARSQESIHAHDAFAALSG